MQGGFYPRRHWGTEVLQPSRGVGTEPESEWGNLGGTKQHHDRHLAVFVICPQTSPLTLQRSGFSIFPTPQFFPFWLSFFFPPFMAWGIKSRGCHMVGKYSALGHLHSSSFCHFSMVLPVITVLWREDPWGRLSANPPRISIWHFELFIYSEVLFFFFFEIYFQDLERWFSDFKIMLLYRTQVQFSSPIWWLITIQSIQ